MSHVNFVFPSLKSWRAKGWKISEDAVPDTFEAQQLSCAIEKWALKYTVRTSDYIAKEREYVIDMLVRKFLRDMYSTGQYPVGDPEVIKRHISSALELGVYGDSIFTGFVEQYILYAQQEGQRIANETLEQSDKLCAWIHRQNPLSFLWWWVKGKLGLHKKELEEAQEWVKWLNNRHPSRMV